MFNHGETLKTAFIRERFSRAARLLACLLGALAAAAPAADAASLFAAMKRGGVAFKVVRPPAPGAKKRLLFQSVAIPATPAARAAPWFWNAVGAELSAARPDRLRRVIGELGEELGRRYPGRGRIATAQRILAAHGADLRRESRLRDVSLPLLLSVIAVESGGRSDAVSPAGARGLMQLMPATAARFGVSDPFDPAQNIRGGAAYLDVLLREFGEDELLALAAYNAGEGAVRKHGGVPPFPETRAYVPLVLAEFRGLRLLCDNSPQDAREACGGPVPAAFQPF